MVTVSGGNPVGDAVDFTTDGKIVAPDGRPCPRIHSTERNAGGRWLAALCAWGRQRTALAAHREIVLGRNRR